MKKRIFSLLVCLIFCFSCGLTASAETYKGFTYDFWEEAVPSQIGYTVENVYRADDISKEIGGFSEPKDMFITDEQDIYILDSGNSRVVVLDKEFKLKKIIDRFVYNQEEFSLSNPTGIFVDKNGKMYIADPKSSCVLISDANGVVEAKLEKPSTDMLDEKLEFLPQKVLVDSAGTIYVSATGIYQGALLYKPDGEFDGFYGSNTVDVSAKLLLDRFWKSILTNEQADNIAKYFPEEFTSFDIDERDFVFTVTKTTSTKKKIKKLNPMGRDTLEAEKFGELESVPINGKVTDSVFVDIVVSNSGVFSALDQRSNRVFQYDSEGELLFVFGGNGSQSGTFLTPVAIETMNDKLLVLDSQKNNITVFAPTDFGNMVLEAVSYYIDGKYGEASALWEEILKYDHNYLTAYVSIGKTLMAEEKYEQAAEYFKLASDRDGNSDAFQAYRNQLLQKNFIWICLVAVALIALLIFLLNRKKKSDNSENKKKYISPFKFLVHPIDSAEDMKRQNAGSLLISFVILLLWFVVTVFKYAVTGFRFNYNDVDMMNIGLLFLTTVPVFVVGVVSNWGVCTLMNGKGKMKDIWIAGSYCLIPYIVSSFLYTLLSHFFVLSEEIFLNWILWIGIIWSACVLLGVLSGIHDYSFKGTIGSVFLTVIAMLIVAFLILLVVSLLQQAFAFVSSIVNELIYRIR